MNMHTIFFVNKIIVIKSNSKKKLLKKMFEINNGIFEKMSYNVVMSSILEDTNLKKVGLELMFLTPEKYSNAEGITYVELAKLVGLPVEEVKKKLNILKEKNIVRVKGMNPKFWKFDEYNFHRLDDDDEIFHLLCNFEDVDFDKYFTY